MCFKRITQIINNAYNSGNIFLYFFLEIKKIFFQTFPYFKYLYDTKNNSVGNNHYYNFWETYKYDFWVDKFINSKNINKDNKPIDYISVMGPRNIVKYLKNTIIFYTAEDIGRGSIHGLAEYEDYLLNDANLSIGFREYDNMIYDNYFRFPLWITQLIDVGMTQDEIKKRIDEINNRGNIKEKNKFCTLIARYDKNGERLKIYNKLSKYGKVDCPSLFNHNIDVILPDYDAKRNFMEDYRFNICLENHSVKGYVTEKLIDAFRSKCIPIYNGILTDFDKKIINQDAIINTTNPNRLKQVEDIQSSDKKYEEFIRIKPFKNDAIFTLVDYMQSFEQKLRRLF